MTHAHFDYMDSLRFAAQEAGIEMPEETLEQRVVRLEAKLEGQRKVEADLRHENEVLLMTLRRLRSRRARITAEKNRDALAAIASIIVARLDEAETDEAKYP